jgi:hypothetical protein
MKNVAEICGLTPVKWGEHHKRAAPEKPKKPGKGLNRRTAARKKDDEIYLALRDVYLHENPRCAMCRGASQCVHHVVRGVAGRARSLLNSDTWLGLCNTCHDAVERLPIAEQVKLKQSAVKATIERLRK